MNLNAAWKAEVKVKVEAKTGQTNDDRSRETGWTGPQSPVPGLLTLTKDDGRGDEGRHEGRSLVSGFSSAKAP